jgi:NAD(P)-dependent dehydrogenase (short-subunit alcohol dehydrogenase family)
VLSIDLTERVVLVVGGSRGIGEAVTRAANEAGARVVFTHTGDPRHAAGVAVLQKELAARGSGAEAVALDALDPGGAARLVERIVRDRGRLDALVCNVGKNTARAAEALTDEQWDEGLATNLSATFYAVRAVLPPMLRAGHGKILLIGSSAVYDGGGGAIDYAAAKGGLEGMMSYLCRTYTRRGILTNVIHPCVIETDLLKARYADEESRKRLIQQIPAGRLGKPEDIGGLAAFLLSPWGDYICGQKILADGGRTLFSK